MPLLADVTLEGIKVTELVVGSVLGIAVGASAAFVPRLRPLLPIAGAVVGVLLLAGFDAADGWVVAAVLGTAGAVGGSSYLARSGSAPVPKPIVLAVATAVLGSALLGPAAAAMVEVPRPSVVVVFAAIAALASLASDRRLTATAVVAMAAWTSFGLFLCNPDTEGSSLVGSLLASMAVATTALAHLRDRSRPEVQHRRSPVQLDLPGRAVPLVLLLVWVGVHGADGREDTIIGGYACLGVLLVLPVAVGLSLLVPTDDRRAGVVSGRLLTAVQAPLVVVCSRIGGIRTTAERAALVSAACLAIATAVVALALGHQPRDQRGPDPTTIRGG